MGEEGAGDVVETRSKSEVGSAYWICPPLAIGDAIRGVFDVETARAHFLEESDA